MEMRRGDSYPASISMLDIHVCNAVFHKTTHYNYLENSRSRPSDFSVNHNIYRFK